MNNRVAAIFTTILLIITFMITGCEVIFPKRQIDVTPSEIHCGHEGGDFTVTIGNAREWAVTGIPDWVTVSDEDGHAAIGITPNTSFPRMCELTFDNGISSAGVSIFQECNDILETDPKSIVTECDEDSFIINVICYREWKIECLHDWIKADKYSGEGPDSVIISVSSNSGYDDRVGDVLFISGNDSSAVSILQSKSHILDIDNDYVEIDGDGGIVQILYMSEDEVDIHTECDWIRLINSGSNIRMLAFEVLRNTSERRECKVRLSLRDYPEIFREITVIQGARIAHPELSIAEGTSMEVSSMDDIRLHPEFEDMEDLSVQWSTDSPETASVNEEGVVSIHKSGRCTITASNAYHNVKAFIELNIRIKAASMTILLNDQNMESDPVAVRYPGENLKVGILMDPPEAYSEDVILYTEDTEIIRIEGKVIRCIQSGKATVRAESVYQDLRTSFSIIVL